MPSLSLIVRGSGKDLANRISLLIFEHRSKCSQVTHFLNRSKIEQKGENEFVVEYWSEGGSWSKWWIDAIIKQMDESHCIITLNFSRYEETIQLAQIVAEHLIKG